MADSMTECHKTLPPAVFIMGPTASGKTELAVDVVNALPMDIISVDSVLVYRDMNIGTAKPDAALLAKAPHRLIDICDPTESYSTARFREDALREMAEITASGRVPLLVGGTMLYFRSLQQGLSVLPAADAKIRKRLEEEADEHGWTYLHERLKDVDPEAAQRIHPNDPQRIQRALEVFELTGKAMSHLQKMSQPGPETFPYRVLKLVRAPEDRAVLHARIEKRFHQMLNDGFEQEVRDLLIQYCLDRELPSMRAVGYRQMLQYLQGELSVEEMPERGIIATRQLAKRQFTWLRAEKDALWLDEGPTLSADAIRFIRSFLNS